MGLPELLAAGPPALPKTWSLQGSGEMLVGLPELLAAGPPVLPTIWSLQGSGAKTSRSTNWLTLKQRRREKVLVLEAGVRRTEEEVLSENTVGVRRMQEVGQLEHCHSARGGWRYRKSRTRVSQLRSETCRTGKPIVFRHSL